MRKLLQIQMMCICSSKKVIIHKWLTIPCTCFGVKMKVAYCRKGIPVNSHCRSRDVLCKHPGDLRGEGHLAAFLEGGAKQEAEPAEEVPLESHVRLPEVSTASNRTVNTRSF